MVNFLLGQKSSYTKFPCFLCLWDNRAKEMHWVQREWPKRDVLEVGQLNIINHPLVDCQKTVFPPLHIKLGLRKEFGKAFNKENDCFKYPGESFPGLSEEKLTAGIFDRARIRKIYKDKQFTELITLLERTTWDMFITAINNFLGKRSL